VFDQQKIKENDDLNKRFSTLMMACEKSESCSNGAGNLAKGVFRAFICSLDANSSKRTLSSKITSFRLVEKYLKDKNLQMTVNNLRETFKQLPNYRM